jgi:translation initiation factor IF-2
VAGWRASLGPRAGRGPVGVSLDRTAASPDCGCHPPRAARRGPGPWCRRPPWPWRRQRPGWQRGWGPGREWGSKWVRAPAWGGSRGCWPRPCMRMQAGRRLRRPMRRGAGRGAAHLRIRGDGGGRDATRCRRRCRRLPCRCHRRCCVPPPAGRRTGAAAAAAGPASGGDTAAAAARPGGGGGGGGGRRHAGRGAAARRPGAKAQSRAVHLSVRAGRMSKARPGGAGAGEGCGLRGPCVRSVGRVRICRSRRCRQCARAACSWAARPAVAARRPPLDLLPAVRREGGAPS